MLRRALSTQQGKATAFGLCITSGFLAGWVANAVREDLKILPQKEEEAIQKALAQKNWQGQQPTRLRPAAATSGGDDKVATTD